MRRERTDRIVIHSSKTDSTQDLGLKDLDIIDRQRGFYGLQYHVIIRRCGTIVYGHRGLDEPCVGLRRWNDTSISICLVGGMEDGEPFDNLMAAQRLSLKALLAELREKYPAAVVIHHSELDSRCACPGFNVLDTLEGI